MDRVSTPDIEAETGDLAKMNATICAASDGASSGDASGNAALLRQLLLSDAELALWLEHTGFFNVDHRQRVLSGLRELKAMDGERDKLVRKLHSFTGGLIQSPATRASSEVPTGKNMLPPSPTYFESSTTISTGDSAHGSFTADRAVSSPPPLAATFVVKDSRFFLVKCSNTANIYLSQRDGLWVTQSKNGPAFTEAFKECQSVILFFSINKSRCFQGFARMISAPDPNLSRPDWVQKVNLTSVTHPFRVEWISTAETSFDNVGDLKNPLNESRSVVVGRDGQEYPAECGRKMIALMKAAIEQPLEPSARQQQGCKLKPTPCASLNKERAHSHSDSPDKRGGNAASGERSWRRRDWDVMGASQAASPSPPRSAALKRETRSLSDSLSLIDY